MTNKEKLFAGITLDDLLDEWYGKVGTASRKEFDDECNANLKSLRFWKKMKRLSPHVTFYAERHGGNIYKDRLTYKQL